MSATTRIRTDRQDVKEVEVEIPDFLSLNAKGDDSVESDKFYFVDERFNFDISTWTVGVNGTFLICICRYPLENECSVSLGFGIKKKNGQVENVEHISNLIFLRHEFSQSFSFPSFSRKVLQRRKSELLPSGLLTLVFTFRTADLATGTTATGNGVCCSLPTGTHPGPLPSAEFQEEGAAMSPTTRILTDRLLEVELKIPDFLSLYAKGDGTVRSDVLFGDRFSLGVSPGTGEMNETFTIIIGRYECESECNLVFGFGIKKKDGHVENVAHIWNFTFLRQEFGRFFKFPSFSRDVLGRRRSELLPSGVLTLVFTLRMGDLANGTIATASPCSEPSSAGGSPHNVEASTQTESENSSPCSEPSSPGGSPHNVEASRQTESENCIEKLSDDLIDLMLSGEESDFTVKVQGEEFRLHRNILGSRTPVFRSMLRSEMKEKGTGCVSIDDCEPGTFREFVRYVYSGRVDELSTDTVFGLYTLADKYQVEELKSACLRFIKRTLSVDTFSDVVSLALTYGLKDLLELATHYFAQNTAAIIQTVKWMNFMSKNPIQANELHLKALVRNNSK